MNKLVSGLLLLGCLVSVGAVSFYCGAACQKRGFVDVPCEDVKTRVVEALADDSSSADLTYYYCLSSDYVNSDSYLGFSYREIGRPANTSFNFDASAHAMYVPYRLDFDGEALVGVQVVSLSVADLEYYDMLALANYFAYPIPFYAWFKCENAGVSNLCFGASYCNPSVSVGAGLMGVTGGTYTSDGYYGTYRYFASRGDSASRDLVVDLESLDSWYSVWAIGFKRAYDIGYADGLVVSYQRGFDAGKATGESVGYIKGYNDALAQSGNVTTLGGLFSALVGVPLNVLNGVSAFAVWDIPIISILITFLMIGIILLLVRKFLMR